MLVALALAGCDRLRGMWGLSDDEAFDVLLWSDACAEERLAGHGRVVACDLSGGKIHLVSEQQARRWRLIHPICPPAP